MIATLRDVARDVGGVLLRGSPALVVRGVSTDSRTVSEGELFVALVGPSFDGHRFVSVAEERGAAAAIIAADVTIPPCELPVIVAPSDTLRALGDLAAAHRRRQRAKVVALTGSAGKTTTKEMLAGILGEVGPTLATVGNLNNLVGVPLTLFGLGPEHDYAVVELGMNRAGEIARLARIAAPDVGLITLVAAAHTEGLGGIEGVADAKGELFEGLGPDGIAVVNLDDPRVAALGQKRRGPKLTFGAEEGADVRLDGEPRIGLEGTSARVSVRGERVDVTLPQVGVHQARNAVAAMAAALALGVPTAAMARGLARSHAAAGRMNVRRAGTLTILDDTYNANPESVAMALHTLSLLARQEGRRPVAILGDMRELGAESRARHEEIGRVAAKSAATAFLFGDEMAAAATAARTAGLADVTHGTDFDTLLALVRAGLRPDDLVLVKGSRGMRTERFVAALCGESLPKGGAH